MTSRPSVLLIVLLAVAGSNPASSAASSAVPTAASDPPDRAHLVLEARWWVPAALDTGFDYAFVDPVGGLSGGGEIRRVDPVRDSIPCLSAAYRLPSGALVGVAAWESRSSGAAATGFIEARVGALLASPDFAIGRSLVDDARATIDVRGSSFEVFAQWRAVQSERSALDLRIAARAFRFERKAVVEYVATRNGLALTEFVQMSADSRGVGPAAAILARYRPVRRVALRGVLGLGVGIGDAEGQTSDRAFIDGELDRLTLVDRNGTRRSFLQVDGGLGVDVDLARGWTISVAYDYSRWSGVSQGQRFIDDVSQNTTIPVNDDVTFAGLSLSLRWEF